MPTTRDDRVRRMSVMLPNPLLDGAADAPLPPAPADGVWGTDEYLKAREALAEFDARSSRITPPEVDRRLVELIVRAIHRDEGVVAAMAEAGHRAVVDEPRYLTLADLDGAPPPDGAPLLIPEIGVLSFPAPPEGAEVAMASIRNVVEDVRVQEVGYYQASTALASTHDEVESFGGYAAYLPDDANGSRRWFEAEMSARATAERLPWGVERVNAPAVWAREIEGVGIRVAIVDTGVGPHLDLPRPVDGITLVPRTNSWHDDEGHGTHVAGTIAALRNGEGVAGVAPRVNLLAVKVLDNTGRGPWDRIAAGITWAVNNGADVINLSLGGSDLSDEIRRALALARTRGVTVCAAAGNDYGGAVSYPARDPLCIAVASTTRQNRRAPHSNVGPEVDLAAPGQDILSTVRGNRYEEGWNGTSMATPHVAGVAALVLSRQRLDPSSLQRRLMGNAFPLGSTNEFGAGLVQADRAVLSPRSGT